MEKVYKLIRGCIYFIHPCLILHSISLLFAILYKPKYTIGYDDFMVCFCLIGGFTFIVLILLDYMRRNKLRAVLTIVWLVIMVMWLVVELVHFIMLYDHNVTMYEQALNETNRKP